MVGRIKYKQIQSFVILDIETTGLPQFDFNRTKITEISIVSVLRDHLTEQFQLNQERKLTKKGIGYIPRTINKLSECVYPRRMISHTASDITGLTNVLLEPFHPFDETLFNILMGCLERLTKPICIIAHNGLKFDFPILQAEIQKTGKMFPDDIMCADSLLAFRSLLLPPPSNILQDIQPLNEKKEEPKSKTTSDWDSDEYDELLVKVTIEAENLENYDCAAITQVNKRQCGDGEWSQKINETTPVRSKTTTLTKISRSQTSSVVTPPSTPVKSNTAESGAKAKKKLPFSKSDDNTELKSCKLADVYQYLIKRPISDAHRAESDALALLECITAMGPEFLNWVDLHNEPFNSVKKLW